MSDLSIDGADALLTPPERDLPYLRHDRAAELRLGPGSIAFAGGRIAALDEDAAAAKRFDARGCTVLPGFVDCHTHLPFAGWRAGEYARKVAGEPYAEIARSGGGIRSSVRSLAAASDEEVLAQAAQIAAELLRGGTTCVELKSGYGGAIDGEARQLRLARALSERIAQPSVTTALIAHSVPDGYDPDSWLDAVATNLGGMLAEAGAGAGALDCFVESVAFTNDHLERVGALAAEHGLHLRAHVEQLASHGSVPVALAAGARSVDHLSCLPADHVAPLAAAECAAVLLPGAELLNDEHAAPGRALADAGAIGVLATDLNPGTSPVQSLPLVIGLAVRRYRWSALEAILATTLNAAWVLDLHDELGSLEPGKRGDAVVLDGSLEQLPYRLGRDPVCAVVSGGELAWVREDMRERLTEGAR